MFNTVAFVYSITSCVLLTIMLFGLFTTISHRWLPLRVFAFIVAILSFSALVALVSP